MDSDMDRTYLSFDHQSSAEFEAFLDETMRDSDAERAESERVYWLRRDVKQEGLGEF